MTTISRLVLALTLCSLLLAGCQPASVTPTLTSTLPVLVSPTDTPSPTTTPFSATETPAPEQPILSTVISAGNASQLKQIAVLEMPDSKLNTLVFLPNSRTLISGEENGEVAFWERGTWQKTILLAAQSDFKRDADGRANFSAILALSHAGKMIVTTNPAHEVKGLDLDGKERFSFPFGEKIFEVDISPDDKYLAVGSFSKRLIVYNLETNQQVADLSGDYEYVSNLVFSPDGKTLLVSYERPENVMKTWETATWQETATFSHTTERFDYHDILFTPDGKSLVIASTRNDIEIFDLESQQVVQKLQGHPRAPYQIAFSPDGSLLASASDDMTVRLWDLKTGKAVLVLRNRHEVGTVTFSPDGTLLVFGVWNEGFQVWALNDALPPTPAASASGEIAFASDLDGDFDIWLANADGSNPRQLTDTDAMDLSPAWSPDSSRLAFISNRDGNDELYTMNADGSDVRRLTETPDASESFPAWSPDGQFISFDSERDGNWDVYIVNNDGSNLRRLTDHPGEDWISSWSSDGQKIVFESKRDGNYEIYVVNLDGSNLQRLTQNTVQDGAPKWSPDGSKIAFFSRRDGNAEIYVVNTDGSNPLRLTNRAGDDSFPVWSPDGAWLVFSSGNNQKAEIYLIAADGSQLQALTANGAQNWTPAWRPAQ